MPSISTVVSKTGKQKVVAKGGLTVEIEWKKALDIPGFKSHLKEEFYNTLKTRVYPLIKERAIMQASGATIRTLGMSRQEAIDAYYAATPLTPPERVRVYLDRYRQAFFPVITKHAKLTKVTLDVGNLMFYARWVEGRTKNLTEALLALFLQIQLLIGYSLGRSLTTWQTKK